MSQPATTYPLRHPGSLCLSGILLLLLLLASGCRSSYVISDPEIGELRESDRSVTELAEQLPDYRHTLLTISGSGRLLVSQPGGSDRLSLDYHSNRDASLIAFRNRIGIQGGELLVKNDSILTYNRVDRVAERYALEDGHLTELGELATVNLVDLFHYPLTADSIDGLLEGENHYVIITADEHRITIDKKSLNTVEVELREGGPGPFSRLVYEEYDEADGFYLPRKITIFSRGGETRLTLLARDLRANHPLPDLEIDIPEDIPVQTR